MKRGVLSFEDHQNDSNGHFADKKTYALVRAEVLRRLYPAQRCCSVPYSSGQPILLEIQTTIADCPFESPPARLRCVTKRASHPEVSTSSSQISTSDSEVVALIAREREEQELIATRAQLDMELKAREFIVRRKGEQMITKQREVNFQLKLLRRTRYINFALNRFIITMVLIVYFFFL